MHLTIHNAGLSMDTSGFFDDYYRLARLNSIIIMNEEGVILDVNSAFTSNFGYSKDEVAGESFEMLFTPNDRKLMKPEAELQTVLSTGQSTDEHYVVNREGQEVMTTGESTLIKTRKGEVYIVKDIVNMQLRKQVQLLLMESEQLLDKLFRYAEDIGIIILDSTMRIIKVNPCFLKLFEIETPPPIGASLSSLNSPFWDRDDIKSDIRRTIVTGQRTPEKNFPLTTASGKEVQVNLASKIIDKGIEREICLLIQNGC